MQSLYETSENDSVLSNSPSRRSRSSLRDLSLTSSVKGVSSLSKVKHVSPSLSHKHSKVDSISPLRPETLVFSKQNSDDPPCKVVPSRGGALSSHSGRAPSHSGPVPSYNGTAPSQSGSVGTKSASKKHRTKERGARGAFFRSSAVGPRNDDRRLLRSRDGQRRPTAGRQKVIHFLVSFSFWPSEIILVGQGTVIHQEQQASAREMRTVVYYAREMANGDQPQVGTR